MKKTWFKERACYQIYPRSFKDSNNDGIGDLQGIISKLDYIKNLGAGIIWLSPIYCSPNDDNGYDISNYYDIQKDFGTMEDFKELLNEVHKRDMKLIMDLVVNHTSDEHEWFVESKKSKDNKYHDYYFWRDPKRNKAPNNWTSFFGGDAWKYDNKLNQYYLHLFSPKQPDLNWENKEVREEVKKILKFWLDMGVDGFRCDVINILSKDEGLPNGKFDILLKGREHYVNGPKIHDYLQELKEDVLSKYDCFTVGEACFITPKKALDYIKEDVEELNMVFQFDHMSCDNVLVKWFIKKFKPVNLKKALSKWQNEINGKGWNTLYFENHDQPRSVSRFGNLIFRTESAKMLATFLFFQQGTPFIFQGQEIGMSNADFTSLSEYKDVETHNVYKVGRSSLHLSHKSLMKKIKYMSRDNARTPMQWDDSIHAGFSTATPWIRENKNYIDINTKKALDDPSSIYYYYQKILRLRKEYPVIVYGDYKEYYPNNNKVVCYERNYENEKILVVCNYTDCERKIKLPYNIDNYKLILNNYEFDQVDLYQPYQAKVYYKENR